MNLQHSMNARALLLRNETRGVIAAFPLMTFRFPSLLLQPSKKPGIEMQVARAQAFRDYGGAGLLA